ncbi:MAG: YHS domain-containing (seleno)protein [Hyphomicrobiaceae bacterium]|nr:YHS domain-containing (seleno)protein [Hyphomicrobiaceae bacterium]
MPIAVSRAVALFVCLLAVLGGATEAVAQKPEIYQSGQERFGASLAVGGFDTVAYHTQGLPVPGNAAFRVSWKGAEWRFSSSENRDRFVKEPDKYAPQFGGYCAFAVAYGSTAAGDPRVFSIAKGKLYLNLNESVQSSWARDQDNLIQRAERNWPKVVQ